MSKSKQDLKLSKEQREEASSLLREYLESNFDVEVGNLGSDLFLDFLEERIGGHFYNLGIQDSIHLMNEKTEDLFLLMKVNSGSRKRK